MRRGFFGRPPGGPSLSPAAHAEIYPTYYVGQGKLDVLVPPILLVYAYQEYMLGAHRNVSILHMEYSLGNLPEPSGVLPDSTR